MKNLERFKSYEVCENEQLALIGSSISCQGVWASGSTSGTYTYTGGGSLLEVSQQFALDYPMYPTATCWDNNAQQ